MSKRKWLFIILASLPALVGLVSFPGRFCFTLADQTSPLPEKHVYLTIAEGRIGYLSSTDVNTKPPNFPRDYYDWFQYAMANQFRCEPTRHYGMYHNMFGERGTRSHALGFVHDFNNAKGLQERDQNGKLWSTGAFQRREYQIPAWFLCVPLLLLALGKKLLKMFDERPNEINLTRGFEPDLFNPLTRRSEM